jgi:hypothetical protein
VAYDTISSCHLHGKNRTSYTTDCVHYLGFSRQTVSWENSVFEWCSYQSASLAELFTCSKRYISVYIAFRLTDSFP